jgi:hypothetical protein
VVVAGNDEVAAALEEIAQRSARIAGRRLEVERLSLRAVRERDLERMLRAHALYLEEEDPERTAAILSALAGSGVLTVGGTPGFAALGGMIGLRPEGRRIVFDANPASIRASQVTISARVLQLARIVEGDGSK